MASTLVQAVNANSMNERQTVCWSQDDRLAVSTEKEIIISKIDIFRGGKTFKGSAVSVKVKVSMADLTPKADPWPGLQEKMRDAHKDVQKKVRMRWTYSSLGMEPHSPCWTALRWSPPGLAPNNRTVLVGLTTDHRIIITGMSATGREWVQLADLLDQLVLHQQEAWEQQQQDEKGEQMYSEKCNAAVLSAYASMLPLAAVDVQWSHVMEEGAGQGQCVLLFAVMKNADIVTWSITLPCVGIDSCRIVDRQRAGFDGIVSSLSWTCVPDNPQAGLLAVGYTGGRVEVLCYSVDPNASPDASPHRFTHLLHPGGDYLPVSAQAWMTAQQNSLVLLSSKEQTTCAQVVSVSCHGNRVSGVGKGGDRWKLETGACCHVALGNIMAASGIAVFGDMVLMSAGESVYHLAVTASPTEVKVGTVGEVPFKHTVGSWGCVCLDLSPNAALAVALFRPMFAYNHRNADFRSPVKVHICPVRTDWNSLESLMLSTRVSTMSTSLIDLLELAAHVLLPYSITTETVAMVMHRLSSSPFRDTPVGWRLARHIFSVLKSQCEKKQLPEQVQVLASAQRKMTERLLCGQISQVCLALQKTQPQVNATDVSTLNMMLNWVRWSEERSEALGSELVGQLSRAVGQSQPEICALCGGDVDLTDGVTVSCGNSHKFGLCCHSLAVCNTVAYQCCMTCGVLALSPKTLKGLPCMGENCSKCTLCQSYLYSTNSSVRL